MGTLGILLLFWVCVPWYTLFVVEPDSALSDNICCNHNWWCMLPQDTFNWHFDLRNSISYNNQLPFCLAIFRMISMYLIKSPVAFVIFWQYIVIYTEKAEIHWSRVFICFEFSWRANFFSFPIPLTTIGKPCDLTSPFGKSVPKSTYSFAQFFFICIWHHIASVISTNS